MLVYIDDPNETEVGLTNRGIHCGVTVRINTVLIY